MCVRQSVELGDFMFSSRIQFRRYLDLPAAGL